MTDSESEKSARECESDCSDSDDSSDDEEFEDPERFPTPTVAELEAGGPFYLPNAGCGWCNSPQEEGCYPDCAFLRAVLHVEPTQDLGTDCLRCAAPTRAVPVPPRCRPLLSVVIVVGLHRSARCS